MSRSVRILLADNQPLIAAGLHHFLSTREDADIVGQVDKPDLLEEMLQKHRPDLLIADYNLPNFINKGHLQAVKEISPETHVLILSSDDNKSNILDILQLGVKGYVTKECSREEVLMAIQSTAKGEKFFCHKILDIIMEKHFSPEP
ncbi:MAG TPA: response regulator transcription factor, partial [Saprospiraceae bacterium]